MKTLHFSIMTAVGITVGILVLSITLSNNEVFAQTSSHYFQNNTQEKIDVSTISKISNTPSNQTARFDVLDWSPDGKVIVFKYIDYGDSSGTNHLGLIEPSTGKAVKINMTFQQNYTLFDDARFSKSDNSLLIVLLNGNIYHYNLNDNTLSQITTSGGIYLFQVLNDGNMVYSQQDNSGGNNENQNKIVLWLTKPDGTKIKELYNDNNVIDFDLSPDEKKIVLINSVSTGPEMPPNEYVKIINLETNQTNQLDLVGSVVNVKWSPNGQLLVYHSIAGDRVPGGTLEIREPTSGFDEVLYSTYSNPSSFVISPDGKSIVYGVDFLNQQGDASQLYRMDLLHPIPEFSFAIPILLISITSLIVFYRMRSKMKTLF